jgi:hypothetical protein
MVVLAVGGLRAQTSPTGSSGAIQRPRTGLQQNPLGGCSHGEGRYRRTFQGGALALTIAAQDDELKPCRAELRDSNGKVIFATGDQAVSALLVDDINGDHEAEVVLEGYSGGAHCCWTYDIVNVGRQPRLVGAFESQHGAAFRQSKDKQYVIVTGSDAFDYFDGLCYACSPGAPVYFLLEGTKFRDVSPVFAKLYDQRIAEVMAQLTPEKLARFRQATAHPATELEAQQWDETKAAILTVIINYLYSGRPRQAWDEFSRLWPETDQPRMRALIEKTMSEGVLKSIREWNAKH